MRDIFHFNLKLNSNVLKDVKQDLFHKSNKFNIIYTLRNFFQQNVFQNDAVSYSK